MVSSFLHTVEGDYSVTVISVPLANQSDIFKFPAGSNLTLTCMVTPTPPPDSKFSWSCSTGCSVDKEIEQSVNITELEVKDSGELNCSVIIDDVEYTSESVELRVTGECNTWPNCKNFILQNLVLYYAYSLLFIPPGNFFCIQSLPIFTNIILCVNCMLNINILVKTFIV